jgi:hypothetical protein
MKVYVSTLWVAVSFWAITACQKEILRDTVVFLLSG